MKVKRLEIHGFKSFKDKTVIHFDDGVTGIVGPNGCGKSNIVDSFFWVMGEQSNKHMRADGALDLIFNGSEKYSPLAMAEVTLVLSTGAANMALAEGMTVRDLPPHMRYEEISVTRRLYRNNESEYLINGQTCRLKDIHELFMDTGAGPKAYSIIEQGQISKIVASKPEDRRVLIEEAAGIVKFKARKKESLRKIEATRQNLHRINDIVTEIERQLNFLEKQANKARQYKTYKADLQEKELFIGRKKLHQLQENRKNFSILAQELSIQEIEKRNALQTAELRIENIKVQTSEAQSLAEDLNLNFQNLQREISQIDTKVQLHRRNIQELENSNLSLDEENEELALSIEELRKEKIFLEEESKKYQDLFQNADQILKEYQVRLDEAKGKADELGAALEKEKRDFMAQLGRQNEISSQVHGLEVRVDGLSVQVNSLSQKISDREMDFEIVSEKLTTHESEFAQSKSETEQLKQKTEELSQEHQLLEGQVRDLSQEEAQTRENFAKTEAKMKALQELVENHEGFRADVQKILKDKELKTHLKGVFVDVIQPHPGYEFALEGVLRDFLESLFVDESASAQKFIQDLKDKNLGRASFWPMDFIESWASSQKKSEPFDPQEIVGVVPHARCLAQMIQLSPPAQEGWVNLFQRYFVVDTLEEAIEARRQTRDHYICFVTREGDLVDFFGRISGGSTKSLEGGLLSRKTELKNLIESHAILATKKDELKIQLEETRACHQKKKEELAQVSKEHRESEIRTKTLERDLFSLKNQYQNIQSELERQKNEKENLDEERRTLWEKLDQIRLEFSSLETASKERQQEIENQSQSYLLANQAAQEIQGAMVQLKVDFASAQEKSKHAKISLDRVTSELSRNISRKQEVESLMNRKLDEKDLIAQELQVLEESLFEATAQVQEVEAQLREKKNALEIVKNELDRTYQEQKTLLRTVDEISAQLSKTRLDQERSEMEFQMLFQSLFEKYGILEEAISPQNDEERERFQNLTAQDENTLQIEVDRLREKIRKLGEVNLMAVEEYDEQKKRHEFLLSQREDLLKSIDDLERAIQRINKTSQERFKVAFEEINVRFQRIFPIVFGGGWGKLLLTNPEDLNETGVDIIAEPPGKKVGSIQLMSGGEKALTAVALIFSIFLIKPSPFCVLDEVDAPLDDHNVGKFNALLKEMSTRSQFIIITHNKRTMELNDKLYGVTMEEPGVSKMVSIQIQ